MQVILRRPEAKRNAFRGIDGFLGADAVEGNGAGYEFGDVVRAEEVFVIVLRIALRQQERLAGDAVPVEMGDVQAREKAVATSTREDEPAGIRTPVVVAVKSVAIATL